MVFQTWSSDGLLDAVNRRLEHYRERLREITDMAVREREHAD